MTRLCPVEVARAVAPRRCGTAHSACRTSTRRAIIECLNPAFIDLPKHD